MVQYPSSSTPAAMSSVRELVVVGSGPTSVLCIGAFVDRLGGWDALPDKGILVIGNNHHQHSPTAHPPSRGALPPTHRPGAGRLGLYTTTMSNTTVNLFNRSMSNFDSLASIIKEHPEVLITAMDSEYDPLYCDYWHKEPNERACKLHRVADQFSDMFQLILQTGKVQFQEAGVHTLTRSHGLWALESKTIGNSILFHDAKRVMLATGFLPKKNLPSEVEALLNEKIPNRYNIIDVEEAMDSDRLKNALKSQSVVVLIGYSHSGGVILQALETTSLKEVVVYSRSELAYAFKKPDGSVENDNTGLKQSSAFWTKLFLDEKTKLPTSTDPRYEIHKYHTISTVDDLAKTLDNVPIDSPVHVINCTGYECSPPMRHGITIIDASGHCIAEISHDPTSGQILGLSEGSESPVKVDDVYGYGSAFPRHVPASVSTVSRGSTHDHDIGLIKFSRHLMDCKTRMWIN